MCSAVDEKACYHQSRPGRLFVMLSQELKGEYSLFRQKKGGKNVVSQGSTCARILRQESAGGSKRTLMWLEFQEPGEW